MRTTLLHSACPVCGGDVMWTASIGLDHLDVLGVDDAQCHHPAARTESAREAVEAKAYPHRVELLQDMESDMGR